MSIMNRYKNKSNQISLFDHLTKKTLLFVAKKTGAFDRINDIQFIFSFFKLPFFKFNFTL